MQRIIRIPSPISGEEKYVLREEYRGFGIYQEKTPSGFFTHQDWTISNGKITIQIKSYNNQCKEELYDMIDSYYDTKKFGIKAINFGTFYCMHNVSGERI